MKLYWNLLLSLIMLQKMYNVLFWKGVPASLFTDSQTNGLPPRTAVPEEVVLSIPTSSLILCPHMKQAWFPWQRYPYHSCTTSAEGDHHHALVQCSSLRLDTGNKNNQKLELFLFSFWEAVYMERHKQLSGSLEYISTAVAFPSLLPASYRTKDGLEKRVEGVQVPLVVTLSRSWSALDPTVMLSHRNSSRPAPCYCHSHFLSRNNTTDWYVLCNIVTSCHHAMCITDIMNECNRSEDKCSPSVWMGNLHEHNIC